MASLGCRAGSLLPRLFRLTRQQGRTTAPLLRSVLSECQVNQTAVRQLVGSAARAAQARPVKKEESHEQQQQPAEATIPVTPSRARLAENLDKMLYKLDIEVRRTGRAHPYDLQKIINLVEKEKFCTNTQALLLLRCCGDLLTDESKEARRQRVEHLVEMLRPIVKLDVSHYNSLLKVHLENENRIVASDFLAEMERNGVQPNRVTFQHLIGMYCMDGNIAGATTILEHMKQEDMAINESIFHSLLMGHCLNRDKESVDATLEVMENSGLIPGAETYTTILCSYARARDWNKVEEVLVEARNRDIQLDDGDYFKIIVALCQNKMTAQAQALVSKLPRKTGYFLEMRSALPQILYAGSYDLAFDILLSFRQHAKSANSPDLSGQGIFMVRAMVRSGADLATCMHYVDRMVQSGYTEAPTKLIEVAVEHRDDEFCEELGKALTKAYGEAVLHNLDAIVYLRKQLSGKLTDNEEEALAVVRRLQAVGIKIPFTAASQDIIGQLLDVKTMNPSDVLNRIRSSVPSLSWGFLCNSLIRALLYKEKKENLIAVSGFLLNVSQGVFYPDWWRVSLARSYVLHQDLDSLVTLFFVVSRKLTKTAKENEKDHMRNLFSTLIEMDKYQASMSSAQSSLEIIKPIVSELVRQRIGLPRTVAQDLDTLLKDAELKDLLEEAVKEFESDYWTPQLEEEFLNQRKELYKKAAREVGLFTGGGNRSAQSSQQYKGFFEIPGSLKEMLRIKEVLRRRGERNNRLTDKLVLTYADQDQPQKAVAELREAREANEFRCSPANCDHVIESLIRTGDLEGAVAFYREMLEHSGNVYANSFVAVLLAYARKGNMEKVLELAQADGGLMFLNSDNAISYTPLLEYLAEKGDAENLNKIFNAFFSSRPPVTKETMLFHPLINVHLVRHDLAAAVAEFERICLEHKKLPFKFELTARLIEAEDVEAMQKVLDLSISLIGEERSLYDLALSFLDQGRRAQSKKLLETPGLRYNHDKVTYIMNRLISRKNYEGLEDLVLLSKNVFGCDRDHMFLTWVKAVGHDANKVSDIWMNIQEEGHAPSDKLKAEIARSLLAGGLKVPFVYTPEKAPDAATPSRKKQEDTGTVEASGGEATTAGDGKRSRRSSRQDRKQDRPNKREEAKTAATTTATTTSAIDAAMQNGDLNALMEAIENSHATETIEALRRGLDHLNQVGRYAEVSRLVEAIGYKSRHLRGVLQTSLTGLMDTGHMDQVRAYVARIPETHAKNFKTEALLRTHQAQADTESFVSLLQAGDVDEVADRKKWLLDPKFLIDLFQSKEGLEERLDKLATGGCLPANVLMGRVACSRGDKNKFLKHWDYDTRENRHSVAKDMVIDMHNTDRLRWMLDTLRETKAGVDALDVAVNQCTSRVKTQQEVLEAVNIGLSAGVGLDHINSAALRRLADLRAAWPHSEEAERVLAKRTQFQAKATASS